MPPGQGLLLLGGDPTRMERVIDTWRADPRLRWARLRVQRTCVLRLSPPDGLAVLRVCATTAFYVFMMLGAALQPAGSRCARWMYRQLYTRRM